MLSNPEIINIALATIMAYCAVKAHVTAQNMLEIAKFNEKGVTPHLTVSAGRRSVFSEAMDTDHSFNSISIYNDSEVTIKYPVAFQITKDYDDKFLMNPMGDGTILVNPTEEDNFTIKPGESKLYAVWVGEDMANDIEKHKMQVGFSINFRGKTLKFKSEDLAWEQDDSDIIPWRKEMYCGLWGESLFDMNKLMYTPGVFDQTKIISLMDENIKVRWIRRMFMEQIPFWREAFARLNKEKEDNRD